MVSVSDTGVGLPHQHADQIFDAFFTTKPHGTGMGLRISRPLLSRMAAACGPPTTPPVAQVFISLYPSKPRHMNNTRRCIFAPGYTKV